MSRLYVGYRVGGGKGSFRSPTTPTFASHGDKFAAVVGPFRTVAGAKAMIHYGNNNPHCRCVSEAERLGRKYAAELANLPSSN